MSQFGLDDSDCIIEEQNITCISLNDSHDAEEACEIKLASSPALEQDLEEGEVSEEYNGNLQKETICEVKFLTKTQYNEFGQLITEILKDKLGYNRLGKHIEISEINSQECVTLIVQKVKHNEFEDIPMPPPLGPPLNTGQQSEAFERATSPDYTALSKFFAIDTAPSPLNTGQQSEAFERATSPDYTALSKFFAIDTAPSPLNTGQQSEAFERATSPDYTALSEFFAIDTAPSPLNTGQQSEAFERATSPDYTGLSELFAIDTAPSPKIDSVIIPSYKRVVKDALLDGEAAAHKKRKENEVFKTKKTNSCFNCGETGHSIRECSKPHNAKRIKNAKRACFKVERYHVDVEQRFSHLKPGCISNKLREALGLRKGEIPFFFYRMRAMGYPPGWLEDAKVEHSGINLFNSDGSKILHSDEDEGEIDPINHKYNISKIYDFPGFNQDPGENFYDDYRYHNVPPLDKRQMKSEFIKTLGDNILKGYKRKKLKDFPNASTDDCIAETTIHESTDMDIEDPETTTLVEVQFTRPPPPSEQPISTPPPPPPATPPPTCEYRKKLEDADRNVTTQSPSLIELEKQKKRLLQELQSNTSITEIEDSLIDEIIELEEEEDDNISKHVLKANINSDNSLESMPAIKSETGNIDLTPTVIKESFKGTPVLKFSPYDNLPNGDNFKVGVSDVINFENLPDSTGKYEQMKKVIKKVRSCINKLQSED